MHDAVLLSVWRGFHTRTASGDCTTDALACDPSVATMAMQELREMVVRGAHKHPGAVAVEDELGRVILLHKLSREVCCA